MLKGKKIVIGITGSIAAYKIPFLVRLLIREDADVQVIMTQTATDFVTPLTLSTLSRRPVIVSPFNPETGEWSNHVELGRWADLMVFAPASANTLGKMANGIADNFLVTAYLSAKCPVFIAPAMDLDMFNHPATQKNINILRTFGNLIIEPQVGELASGLSGPGRMEEPEKIVEILRTHFSSQTAPVKKKVLVTAGPTYEKIDPVRFIGNFSSGKMGFSLATEAASRHCSVTLVTGPTGLICQHPAIHRIDILSANEMHDACMKESADADIIIMAAAVADYTVTGISDTKLKKTGKPLNLELTPTKDILMELGRRKRKDQILVGFALETDHELEHARKKLNTKNLDYIVLNSLQDKGAGFGTATNKITIIDKQGTVMKGELKAKQDVASDILDVVLTMQKTYKSEA
jgi:phosphopantothenoylcysteine decarboxylase/phosphopantothenate--cysteine ligase